MGREWFLDVLLKQKVIVGSAHPTYLNHISSLLVSFPLMKPDSYIRSRKLNPNLIFGSLQLLCWLIFHPSVLKQNLNRMNTIIFTNNSGGETEIRSQFRRLLIKGFVILPGIASTFVGLLFMYLGEPFWESLYMILGFAILSAVTGLGYCIGASQISKSLVFGMATGILISTFFSIILGVLIGLEKGLGGSLQNSLSGFLFVCAVGSMAGGVVIGIGAGASGGEPLELSKTILFPFLIAILGSLVSGQNNLIMSVIIGAVSGVSATIGLLFNYWRPVLMYPLLEIWNLLIYFVDKR